MVIEEQALAGFSALELRLAGWPFGVRVPNASVRLLPGEPPLARAVPGTRRGTVRVGTAAA
jgi:hypothetical protein